MARRALPATASTLIALTAIATLTLTACGGGGDAKSADIKGADTGAATPTVSASAGSGQPDLSLPSDVHVEFDVTQPSDARHAAALSSAKNYILALKHGITAQDPKDPAYQLYSLGNATKYAQKQIQAWVDGEWTATGTDSYYKARTDNVGGSRGVLVTMCRDQSKSYGKNVKTNKIKYTKASLDDYQEFRLLMASPQDAQKIWKVLQIEVQGRVKECQR
ncbi:hypothetical protein [Streptomyces sp. NPDC056190]|uniref:hypothetical protein n=1 Tax=Streptomyces sp. NPDC056190 TaxID=3345741 RepID=UPI0035DF28A8